MQIHLRKWSCAGLIAATLAGQASPGKDSQVLATAEPSQKNRTTLFYLALRGGIDRIDADGANQQTLVTAALAGSGPDGIAIDAQRGHVYWTTMGKVSLDDGTVMRADLDGRHVTTIVPAGSTFTPKQLKLDALHRKLYWSDREGMRVMRANLDGTGIETLVQTGAGASDRVDAAKWCVGIAIDARAGKLYWSQKGGDNARQGMIRRAGLELPPGQSAANRSDIETVFAALPEPIDLEFDEQQRMLYWTDRGDNTISRAYVGASTAARPPQRIDREILMRDLGEAIGITLDTEHQRLFYSSLDGVVGTATLAGKNPRKLLKDAGALTGIVAVDLSRQ